MFSTNPEVYVFTKGAMEHYCQEEGIVAKPMADLFANAASVLDDVKTFARKLQRVLTAHQPAGQSTLRTTVPAAVAK